MIDTLKTGNLVECSGLKLAEAVLSTLGSKSRIAFQALPADDPKQRQPDIREAQRELEWEPKVTLKDGLKETIKYFQEIMRGDI